MNMRRNFLIFLFLSFSPFLAFSQQEEALNLNLEECIVKALKDNLKLAVEVYNPELADAALTRAKEIFLPSFSLGYGAQQTETPPYWWIQGAQTVVSKDFDYSVSIVQQIPTGGNFSLSLSSYKTDTNQSFQLLNPRYGSTLRLDITQPLLKNFGYRISRKEILIARNNLDISRNQLKSALINTIYSVQEAYWNLFYARENFNVKQQSLHLARDLLAKNKKEVELGKLAPLEVLNAEAVVASREAEILQAEALIRRSEDVLKNILNFPDEEDASSQRIFPSDQPLFVKEEVSLEEALKEAVANRPDLKMKRTGIETRELNFSVAKNQMLPGLDLKFSYWSPGISGDRLLYLDDNPFLGIVTGKEKGSPNDSLRDAFNLLYKNWSVGLTLTVPLSNVLTRADFVKARLELEQSLVELEDSEKQVILEVRDAVREIETNAKKVEAYGIARELAEKRLEAEEKKLSVGLTTNYFVLQFQEELANARSLEIKSLVDYNLALAKLEKAVGSSLERRGIKISGFEGSMQP